MNYAIRGTATKITSFVLDNVKYMIMMEHSCKCRFLTESSGRLIYFSIIKTNLLFRTVLDLTDASICFDYHILNSVRCQVNGISILW